MSQQSPSHPVRRAAVLGAGVMGAQIAAHLVNAGIECVLFELAADKGRKNSLVEQAIGRLKKLKPAPLGTGKTAELIIPANYEEHLELLADCDLVIEAIAERMDWKKDLYDRIEDHVADHAILASNTSGLSITELTSVLPDSLADRFCGVHFFNPPRYMHLVELIPHAGTDPAVMDHLEAFLTTAAGKGVVRAKDTPNFIGNRIGVFSMLSTMHHTAEFGLGFDTVDALTGPAIGRPKSATYRTADVVGLDTMQHVNRTMQDKLEDDPWHQYFDNPAWLNQLVEAGALGQKAGAGVYRKEGRNIRVLDPESGEYRDSDYSLPDAVQAILKERNPGAKLQAARNSDDREGQFLWAIFRDLFHYCAYHLADIADSAREVDFAIRWGYGWDRGPFELWQAAGWQQVAGWIAEDIEDGKAMADAALPEWVTDGREGVHRPEGSWSAAGGEWVPRPELPVYDRQLWPELLIGENRDEGSTVFEDEAVRIWTLDNDDVLLLSFKTKMHTINQGVVDGIHKAVDMAEADYAGLVIWQPEGAFCAGADLKGAAEAVQSGRLDDLENLLEGFQNACMRLKYAMVPTISAVRGLALGGGCEIVLQTSHAAAAYESYVGLVEAGVGLLPGGGGLKELAIRSITDSPASDAFPRLQQFYEQVAMGKVAGSAAEAREFGYLRATDDVVMNPREILYVAQQKAVALHAAGYRPPLRNRMWFASGRTGHATLRMLLENMLSGEFISEHDHEIGNRIAEVICGGDVERGSELDEAWYLRLEREHFLELAQMEKTQERISHMLKTGKPLRN